MVAMLRLLQPELISRVSRDYPALPIDTRDIANVAVKALTENGHHGKGYVLNESEALSRSEVAAEISKASAKPVKYVNVDDAALRNAMAGAPQKLTNFLHAGMTV